MISGFQIGDRKGEGWKSTCSVKEIKSQYYHLRLQMSVRLALVKHHSYHKTGCFWPLAVYTPTILGSGNLL